MMRNLPLLLFECREFLARHERERGLVAPVTRGFLDAQEEMHHVHESINQFVSKTLELGRMPVESDFASEGGCGDGCGCGHSH